MPNRLAASASPYLLQHQHNPVDWYPWGDEALARARAEDRPILLSVGYSACHWCHVMERESFEDEATAAYMNEHFVNIKVDREERPDLDTIYMTAVQTFTGGRGGWPMTVFLLPDGRPYFGGTYFPPRPAHGMPSFQQVMEHAVRLVTQRRREVEAVTEGVVGRMRAFQKLPAPDETLAVRWLDAVTEAAEADFDPVHGGFGAAPKFPPHGTLAVLLAQHARTGHRRALEMVEVTLDRMAQGAMYDHLGGGFARYSVDERWAVPHFEKMLYDNGQLLPVYLDAWLLTGRPLWRRVVVDSLGWLEREMLASQGAFYASQDADSEGEEGRFFVWTPAQLAEVLGDGAGRAATLLGITSDGTFEHGASVLRMETALEDLPEDDQVFLRQSAFPALFAARAARVAPGTDTKIVTAWNALVITAFARAGAALREPRWVQRAVDAAEFLWTTATPEGRLLRTWKDGVPGPGGYADDHAFLVVALIDVYEATLDLRWLDRAVALADRMLALFWDEDDGGLYYTGHDAEALVARTKNLTGGALPSANGMAALGLLRLGTLVGREDLRDKAGWILRSMQMLLGQAARALGPEAIAGDWMARGGSEIGLVGDGEPLAALVNQVHSRPRPFSVVAAVPGDHGRDGGAPTPQLLPWMAHRTAPPGEAAAYVCQGHVCLAPVTSPAELAEQLRGATEIDRGPAKEARVRSPRLPDDPFRWIGSPPLGGDALRGQVVVLDFWALCCINCHHVLPELAALERRFVGEPVRVVGVHSAKFPHEQERAAVALAVERYGITHPVLNDPDRALWSEFAVKAWPTLVVLDPTGREAFRKSGEVDRDELGRVVQRLLDEARDAGTLGEPAAPPAVEARAETPLRHPSKVHVFPGVVAQARGTDPLVDPDARLYVAETGAHVVRECELVVGPDGWPAAARVLRTFGAPGEPGFVDGAAPRFRDPRGMSRLGDVLWLADTGNHAVRTIDLRTGSVETVAGTGRRGRGARVDPTRPREADLRSPWAVEATDGAVFVAMAGTHQIWVILPDRGHAGPMIGSGAEDHVDGSMREAALAQPSGMALFGASLFWADSETSSIRMADLEEGEVQTVVGQGLFDFGDVDGAGAEVRLQHPLGVTVSGGALWVADTYNHKIKRIDLAGGETVTVAGGADGALREPEGIDALGQFLVIADTGHGRLRVMDRETGALRDLPLR
jgi:uncharacterized protein YyaL (SSP411 family)/thiol-disulfide isomerase/thioredoxin